MSCYPEISVLIEPNEGQDNAYDYLCSCEIQHTGFLLESAEIEMGCGKMLRDALKKLASGEDVT